MADYRIDQLTAIDALVAADQIPVWDASLAATRRATITQVLASVGAPAVVEGSFTPTLSFNGAAVGLTYSAVPGYTQAGRYIRIGNLVWFNARIGLAAKGSSAGTLRLEGLPYAVAVMNTPCSLYIANLAGLAADLTLQPVLQAGATYAIVYKHYPTGNSTSVANTDVSDGLFLFWSGSYQAA